MTTFTAGIVIPHLADSSRAVQDVREAEAAGVQTAWQTSSAERPDTLTMFAAAAAVTDRIALGTAIVPTYPRHPAIMASQVRAIEGIAPGRLRLGIGPSHQVSIEQDLELEIGKPLSHLREYTTILRALLRGGTVRHTDDAYRVNLTLGPDPPALATEVLVSALNVNEFRVAGEIADGAISWVAPIPYLVATALPALAEGAATANRTVPPLIAHVPVAVTPNRDAALAATSRAFGGYANYPFYARMFEAAGFPPVGTTASPKAIESLAVYGMPDHIQCRLEAILAECIGEVMVSLVAVNDQAAEWNELIGILAG